ncbi:hypothetical protein [Helicobacter sp. 13S00482-2]|uniref:hypothetical protein n=1 Tax=Helicobacter sp. 13S00482-2 TaxID=1476200 RepID=UPI0015DA355C|nr:hypothetical protein [Helicobacter sp. 13S00482-2]
MLLFIALKGMKYTVIDIKEGFNGGGATPLIILFDIILKAQDDDSLPSFNEGRNYLL